MPRSAPVPSYRSRKGYSQAIVTLTDSQTGKRRDYWLGEHGTRASKELYFRLLAEWESSGRRLPEVASPPPPAPSGRGSTPAVNSGLTIDLITRDYSRFARGYYTPSCASGIKVALRVLRERHGTTAADRFGPNALRLVRDAMIQGRAGPDRPRSPWCRKTVNTRVGHIIRMFRWAASREMIGPQVYQSLQALPALRRGRSAAKDHEYVTPVPQPMVDAVKPLVSRQVRALIELPLLSDARPGDLLKLRAVDIDNGGELMAAAVRLTCPQILYQVL